MITRINEPKIFWNKFHVNVYANSIVKHEIQIKIGIIINASVS